MPWQRAIIWKSALSVLFRITNAYLRRCHAKSTFFRICLHSTTYHSKFGKYTKFIRICCKLSIFKPWPNVLTSGRKTWVYLWLRLARAFVHLSWLAMTCAHFGRDQICTQVKVSFSPFHRPVNVSWVTSINLLLTDDLQDMSSFKWVFATCVY